ncbi:MAG: aspartate/tyrosine/aromatic aminotransferase [Chlamydiales bacterium]
MSIFSSLSLQPDDFILKLNKEYRSDNREIKVNLGVGAYRDLEGRPYILPSVAEAEWRILSGNMDKEYQPIEGMQRLIEGSQRIVFGKNNSKIAGVQTIGATGALSLAAQLLALGMSNKVAYIPDPTWANHAGIFSALGYQVKSYPYLDKEQHTLAFDQLINALKAMDPTSVVVFQGSCHNPTGIDPTNEQWEQICQHVKQQQLIPLFDLSYQGFGEGIDEDAFSVRHFFEEGIEMCVAVSHAKNFGLYGERVGHLSVVTESDERAKIVLSQLKTMIRSRYSSPPLHGARMISEILNDEKLELMWREDLRQMRQRVQMMRTLLVDELEKCSQRQGIYEDLRRQKGFFSFLSFPEEAVNRLKSEYGIYMTGDSRINVAGLTVSQVPYVAEAIHSSRPIGIS